MVKEVRVQRLLDALAAAARSVASIMAELQGRLAADDLKVVQDELLYELLRLTGAARPSGKNR